MKKKKMGTFSAREERADEANQESARATPAWRASERPTSAMQ